MSTTLLQLPWLLEQQRQPPVGPEHILRRRWHSKTCAVGCRAGVKAICLHGCENNSAPVFWITDQWHLVCAVWTEHSIMENLRVAASVFSWDSTGCDKSWFLPTFFLNGQTFLEVFFSSYRKHLQKHRGEYPTLHWPLMSSLPSPKALLGHRTLILAVVSSVHWQKF